MSEVKSKALKNIEEKMADLDVNSLRYHILESAKNFKCSWIELGRALYTAYKDKLYKDWGYGSFEIYVARETGIRKQTAMKLLKSYYFLEKEEPQYLKNEYTETAQPANLPSYESVNVLRQAKNNKALDRNDYAHLKKEVFENGRDSVELKKNLGVIVRQRKELDPDAQQEKKKGFALNRLLSQLRLLKQEVTVLKLLSVPLVKDLDNLIKNIDQELKEQI